MSRYVAFLRGINLGKRQVKMDDLKTCLAGIGLTDLKTIVASGNVSFATVETHDLKSRIEAAIADRFGFEVGVILRSIDDLQAMRYSAPFAGLDPKADLARHVLLFDQPLPADLKLDDRPGHTEIVGIGVRDIFLACYRQPNGRYTEGVEDLAKQLDQQLGKAVLQTMRNFNTIEKALA